MKEIGLPDCTASQSLKRQEPALNREKQTGKLVGQGRHVGSIRNKELERHASSRKDSEDGE